MSPDPVAGNPGAPQSWNAYTYVVNNPLSYADPEGLDPIDVVLQYWAPTDSTSGFVVGLPGDLGGLGGIGLGDPAAMACGLQTATTPRHLDGISDWP